MTKEQNPKIVNVYQAVTNRILDELRKGVIPWKQKYVSTGCRARNHESGKPYSILNAMLVGGSGEFLTFNQIKRLGGTLRKGCHAHSIYLYKMFIPKERKEKAEQLKKEGKDPMRLAVPILWRYNVFNIADVDGLKDVAKAPDPGEELTREKMSAMGRNAARLADVYAGSQKTLKLAEGGESAYDAETDTVTVPRTALFTKETHYAETLLKELVHSTSHPERCDRKAWKDNDFTSPQEELAGEIGASMLMYELGLENETTVKESASYIARWIREMEKDERLVVAASSQAEKAAKFILNAATGQ